MLCPESALSPPTLSRLALLLSRTAQNLMLPCSQRHSHLSSSYGPVTFPKIQSYKSASPSSLTSHWIRFPRYSKSRSVCSDLTIATKKTYTTYSSPFSYIRRWQRTSSPKAGCLRETITPTMRLNSQFAQDSIGQRTHVRFAPRERKTASQALVALVLDCFRSRAPCGMPISGITSSGTCLS